MENYVVKSKLLLELRYFGKVILPDIVFMFRFLLVLNHCNQHLVFISLLELSDS